MKALTLCAVSALTLTAVACSHRDVRSAALTGRLNCPEQSGALKRLSKAEDGRSCEYEVANGAQVSLKLMPVGGAGAMGLLARLEADLRAEAASTPDTTPIEAKDNTKADHPAAQTVAEAKADAAKAWSATDAGRNAAETSDIARTVDEKLKARGLGDEGAEKSAHVNLPGVRIDADDKNDSAHVALPGVHIDAEGDGAAIRVGPLHIDTDHNKAVVKAVSDVRLRGEGFARTQRGLAAMFVYAGDNLGGGYKYVGYEAAGPKAGPLTIAIIKSRKEGGFHGDVYGDVKRLVRRNGGI
ncbi:MAG: hypothetical protein CGW95_07430 [Phenylobacterium zucineum]|nr:MAG: hypothetical protein CGW95_07430 [Phenylobacterium zucineum]